MHRFAHLFSPPAAGRAASVDPAEARQRQAAGALLVDVRELEEWRAGHAAGAVHIPLGQLPGRLAELPGGRELLLVCRSGNRSGQAQRLLLARGHPATNVDGGMLAWERAGLPVER